VIDPDLEEELRVTVVATGLGVRHAAKSAKEEPTMRLVASDRTESVIPDYRDMDRPAVYRKGFAAAAQAQAEPALETDLDYLDIPAFLRRQAD
jgi:cell division protein FtsZ